MCSDLQTANVCYLSPVGYFLSAEPSGVNRYVSDELKERKGVANISVTTSELVNILSYVEEMPFQFGIFNGRRPKKFLSTNLCS